MRYTIRCRTSCFLQIPPRQQKPDPTQTQNTAQNPAFPPKNSPPRQMSRLCLRSKIQLRIVYPLAVNPPADSIAKLPPNRSIINPSLSPRLYPQSLLHRKTESAVTVPHPKSIDSLQILSWKLPNIFLAQIKIGRAVQQEC